MANPANHNKVWTDEEREQLRAMWSDNTPLENIANTFARTASSVVAQLQQMQLVFYSARTEAFYIAEPIWTMKDVQRVDKKIKEASPMDPS